MSNRDVKRLKKLNEKLNGRIIPYIESRDENNMWTYDGQRRAWMQNKEKTEKAIERVERRMVDTEMRQSKQLRNPQYIDLNSMTKPIKIIDDVRRDRNWQQSMANKVRRKLAFQNAKYALEGVPGLSQAQKDQILEEDFARQVDVIELENPRLPTKRPFQERDDYKFYNEERRRLQDDLDTIRFERVRRIGRENKAQEIEDRKKRDLQAFYDDQKVKEREKLKQIFFNRQRPIPPSMTLTASQMRDNEYQAAMATAGGLANIREYRPMNDQELIDAGYAMTRRQASEALAEGTIYDNQLPNDWEPNQVEAADPQLDWLGNI